MNAKKFERVWYMCDYARQRVFVREEFLLWLDKLQSLGYNGIGLYLEGAFMPLPYNISYGKGI